MADDLWHFPVTVPAGTTQAAPLTVATVFPSAIVETVRWRVPPGANGQVGFKISMRGVAVIPADGAQFVVDSASTASWPLTGFPDSGDWSVTAYNTGAFPHTIHVTYLVKYARPEPARPELAALAELHNWPGADAGIYEPGLWG